MTTMPLVCPSCHAILRDWPTSPRADKDTMGPSCRACGYLPTKAELERQADDLAAALFEGLDE
jgi:hypothetical protein